MNEDIVINKKYDDVRAYLETHKNVDMVTGGGSPATFRWLTSKNKYVNLGLATSQDNTGSILTANHNSFGVTQEELQEVANDVSGHFNK